jgi:glycosyltransferase involved in cell wall biosynthesis
VRLLVVAAPMISRGGAYSWLCDATPVLRDAGWTVGVVWAARVAAQPPAADWQLRVPEPKRRAGRMRALARAVGSAQAEFEPDRVLSILPQSDLACARARRDSVPWTAMAHGRPYPAPGEGGAGRRLAWRAGVRWAYARADQVVAVSTALGQTLHDDLGVDRVATVHNGVRVPPLASLRARTGRTVGFLGRLSREKAPDLFLAAVRDVDCDARVFGSGSLAEEVRAIAAQLPHVTCEGWTDRERALDAIDLLVLSSRREALPLACIEAGARGIPVLARDVGGVREVLGEDPLLAANCILPAAAPPERFGERLEALLGDLELRQELGRRLRETVAARFALPGQVLELGRLLGGNG